MPLPKAADAARKRKERSDHKRAVQDAEIPAADDSLPTRGRQRSSTPESARVASRSVKEDNAARKRVTRSVTAQVVVQQKRTVQDAVCKTQDAVRKRVTRLARGFNPNPNPDRSVRLELKRRVWQEDQSVRLQLKSNIATLLANEWRVR